MRAAGSPWPWLLAGALLLGFGLRCFQLGSQLPAEDELYSLWMVLHIRYPDRMGSTFPSMSAPAALIGRVVAETVGLSEWTFRLEPLVFGCALLVLGPWLVWRRFGPATAALFAALLAISPLLVLYSRFVRAYAAPTLLVFASVFVLQRWLERQRGRDALGWALCVLVATWFHPLSAPAAIAPALAAALLPALRSRFRVWRDVWPPLIIAAGVSLLALVVMAGPGPGGLERLLGRVGGRILAGPGTLAGATRHLTGSGWPWLAAGVGCAMAAGAGVALRRRVELAFPMLAACGVQLVAVLRSGAFLSDAHWTFARYMIFVLPFLLLFLAVGIAALSRWRVGGREWPLPIGVAAVLLGLLWASGPHPASHYVPNGFMHHYDFQISWSGRGPFWRGGSPTTPHRRWTRKPPPPIPAFYRQLAEEPGDFAIVEAPNDSHWQDMPFHYYQRVHGKRVRVGVVGGALGPRDYRTPFDDPRLRFDTYVDLADPEALRGGEHRYLVFHKGRGRAWLDVEGTRGLYREQFGAPFYEDETLEVFSLR